MKHVMKPKCQQALQPKTECHEHGGLFDDNPGKNTCKTCEDWLVKEGR